LLSIATAAAVIIGGIIAYLLRRRGTTGRVATSDAATLWAQSQEMRTQLIAEKTKAEDQRDRILAIQASQVVPVLASTAESLKQILAALAVLDQLMTQMDRMDAMLTQLRDRYITGERSGR
jgi:trans-2-enoyl-CoA reductase